MTPAIASLIFWAGILAILWLDRDRNSRTSPALWIAVAWFLLSCSRSASQWLDPDQAFDAPAQMLEGSPVDRVVYTGLLVLGIIVLLNRGDKVVAVLRQIGPVVLFFGFCLVSLAWSDYPLVAFKRWNKAIGDLVMVLIVCTDPEPINALKRLISRTAGVLIPLSILLIKYYPALGRIYGRYFGEVHYTGVTTNKNSLGALCLLFGLGLLWSVLDLFKNERHTSQRTQRLIAHIAILSMIAWLFSIVDSMTSLTCLALAGGLLLATQMKVLARNRSSIHILVFLVVLIPAIVVFVGLGQGALQELGRDPTLTDRTRIWSMVFELTPNRWLGTGYESFWLGPRLDAMIRAFAWVPNEAHNGYIEIYANLGWVGVGLLAIVLLHGYQRVVRAWSRNLPAGSLLLAYFVTGIIYNFTEAGFFRIMAPVWLFFLLAITGFPQTAPASAEELSDDGLDAGQLVSHSPHSLVGFEEFS